MIDLSFCHFRSVAARRSYESLRVWKLAEKYAEEQIRESDSMYVILDNIYVFWITFFFRFYATNVTWNFFHP